MLEVINLAATNYALQRGSFFLREKHLLLLRFFFVFLVVSRMSPLLGGHTVRIQHPLLAFLR